MSFEKKMKKRANQKLNAFAKNPYHKEPKHHRLPLWNRILIPVASAAAVLVIGVAIALPLMKNTLNGGANDSRTQEPMDGSNYVNDSTDKGGQPGKSTEPGQGETSQTKADTSRQDPYTSGETGPVPHWDEKTYVQKYPSFSYQDNTFNVRDMNAASPINVSYIDQKLADVQVTGYDPYEEAYHNGQAEVYSIKNIANDAALAIKFSGVDKYYAYHNMDCYFADLGELYNKLGFNTEVMIGYIANYFRSNETGRIENSIIVNTKSSFPEAEIKAIIFGDLTKVNKTAKGKSADISRSAADSFVINTRIEAIDLNDGGMQLYSDGTLLVNMFHRTYEFNIGAEKYTELYNLPFDN